jgi:hypothetical protein
MHGPGAFEAMLAVPEPAAAVLVLAALAWASSLKAPDAAGGRLTMLQSSPVPTRR